MPRSAAVSLENNFNKGLITEATAMNYPENSVVETNNCIYSKNGEVIRRFGIDYETGYQINDYSTIAPVSTAPVPSDLYSSLAIQEYEWTTVNNNGSVSFVVNQVGNKIIFHQTSQDNHLSIQLKTFTIDMTTYQVPTFTSDYGQFMGGIPVSFASGFGYLFIAHPYCNPIYVAYNSGSDSISATAITLSTRDFERLNDTYAGDFRPSSLTDLHKYNLYNQGWYISAKNEGSTTTNVVTYWDAQRTDWPSNADIWWLYKNSSELLDKALFDTQAIGNAPAPNGHYVYNTFDINRDTVLGTTGLPAVSSNGNRPSQVAFFSGRVWYSGVQALSYNSKIYFTKIIEGVNDFGTCYQLSDPTSESNFDLLESDGGVINIPDIAQVLKMVPVGPALLVFATNGIWRISGPNNVFAANDYSVVKVSNISLYAPNSIVVAEGIPIWWDKAGIYTMTADPSTGQENVQNISEMTIQTLVNAIPDNNLQYVKGAYNNIDKNIHWIYRTDASSSILDNYTYNKLLVFNVTSQSFSDFTISDSAPAVSGLVFTSLSNRDPLLNTKGASVVKFLTIGPTIGTSGTYGMTWSQFNDNTYYDWKTYDGVGIDAASDFISGYRIRGELLKKFQSNYVVVIMKTEDDASAFLQGVWDYANSTYSGRLTAQQQTYRSDSEFDYSRSKLKIRGNGYSVQFKFKSEPGKPFTIVGWAVSETGVNVP